MNHYVRLTSLDPKLQDESDVISHTKTAGATKENDFINCSSLNLGMDPESQNAETSPSTMTHNS
jgi:hypothetical protein